MGKVVKLIGYPLGHSVSPAMQNAAFGALGLDWKYELEEVAPDKLEEAIERLKKDPNVAGFNVTVPYKEKIIPLLDVLSHHAKQIGAVNTVVKEKGSEKLKGYNTDGPGFIESLKENANFNVKGKKAVVLGAGGASRAVCMMLKLNGAEKITISDIVEEKAMELAKLVNAATAKVNSKELQDTINEADILVNTSPIGMRPKTDQSPLPENIKLHKNLVVYDLVYNPSETKLLKQAKAAGAKAISGLGMLVHQGALAFKIWTGKDPDIKVMFDAAQKALK